MFTIKTVESEGSLIPPTSPLTLMGIECNIDAPERKWS